MTTYALTTLHLPTSISIAATLIVGLSIFVFSLIGGWLSDKVGRKPLMIWPKVLSTVRAYPAFWLLNTYRSAAVLLLVTALWSPSVRWAAS